MVITIIKSIKEVEALRDEWEYVFTNDRNASIFQSWGWFRGWIEQFAGEWLVFSLRPDQHSKNIAFFALYNDSTTGKLGLRTYNTIGIAGEPLSDYNGLLCLHGYESDVIEHISDYLTTRIQWGKLKFREVYDERLLKIARRIESDKYTVQYAKDTPCPQLNLPATWDKYLGDTLDPKFSKKFVTKIKKADKKGCHITEADDKNFEFYLDCFINLFQMRWGTLDENRRELFKSTFRWSYRTNMVRFHILWYEKTPAAIQVSFIDDKNKMYHYYNGGWDPQFSHLSPGLVLHGHSIKYAIENRYKVYDFMRGDEAYKYLFGAINKYNKNLAITRNTLETKLRKIKNRIVRYASGD